MTVKYLYCVLSSDTIIHMRDASGGHMESIYYGDVAEARSTRLNENCAVLEIKPTTYTKHEDGEITVSPVLEILV